MTYAPCEDSDQPVQLHMLIWAQLFKASLAYRARQGLFR